MNYAVINTETNIVQNIIALEEGAEWSPPQGHFIVPYTTAVSPGDTWNGAEFIPQPPPPVETIVETTPGSTPNVIG